MTDQDVDVKKVKVQCTGFVTKVTGKEEFEMTVPAEATVRQLIDLLEERFGKRGFRDILLMRQETQRPLTTIYINRQDIKLLKGIDTILPRDCSVAMVSPQHPWIGG